MITSAERFIERVHHLLQAGYDTLTPSDIARLNRKTEPDITAGLAMRIQQLIDDRAVPGITRAWSIVDNAPENRPDLALARQPPAKKRKLPDLKFRYGGQRQVLYFRFEAKKLSGTGDYKDLVSHQDGLGRFLRRVYGRHDTAGGLLGYVHTESPIVHAERVRAAIAAEPRKYRVDADGAWTAATWKHGPQCCFRLSHSRKTSTPITIYYSFLLFA